jgi:uncharacterized protein (TIGR02391 family)
MTKLLQQFERIVRRALGSTDAPPEEHRDIHAFDERDIHPLLPTVVKELFDDGHYAQSTFEAFKFVDKEIQRLSGETESGYRLMMKVLSDTDPIVRLTPCSSTSEKDEQKGYQFLFAGAVLAIRNPRGHEYAVRDTPDTCLAHLSLASLLLRRLQAAGHDIQSLHLNEESNVQRSRSAGY